MGLRKMLTMGEAYGTQSVVGKKGRLYKWSKNTNGTWEMVDATTSKVVFRTNTDTKVGSGVKACFGDGSSSTKSLWVVDSVAENIYTISLPETDANYIAGEYLGVDESHKSDAASPTHGIYWDIKGINANTQWALITEDDYKTAQSIDDIVDRLKTYLDKANAKSINVDEEQAVYDNPQSTLTDLTEALSSVRAKLHFITFRDTRTQNICLENWDADSDGELTFEEAQAVTEIGEVFRGKEISVFEELKYFTSLTAIPDNAFRNASELQIIYLPANVSQVSTSAFTACSKLDYVVILHEGDMLACNFSLRPQATFFVPGSMMDAYLADETWSTKKITEFTGKPVVTAEASRIYGRTLGSITTKVLGAPVIGTPVTECESLGIATLPVGTYPIKVERGTVSTPDVEFREGVLTITPSPLTITAKSYTRQVGEANPEFELTYKSFRNKETDTVFVVRPIIECDATIDSPAGEYEIRVSSAVATNYEISYENGVLTVVDDPSGIQTAKNNDDEAPVFDMQGRRVNKMQRGIYIKRNKKIVVKD